MAAVGNVNVDRAGGAQGVARAGATGEATQAQQAMQMLKAVVEQLEKQEAASPGSTDKTAAQELRKLLEDAQRRGPEAAFADPKNEGLTKMLLNSLPPTTNGQGAGGVATT